MKFKIFFLKYLPSTNNSHGSINTGTTIPWAIGYTPVGVDIKRKGRYKYDSKNNNEPDIRKTISHRGVAL